MSWREGRETPNDLLSCSHYPLKGLAAGCVAGAIPHSDAASQDALDGASVEGAHDGGRGSGSSEFAEEVEMLLCIWGLAAKDWESLVPVYKFLHFL